MEIFQLTHVRLYIRANDHTRAHGFFAKAKKEERKHATYVRYHWKVERGGHPSLVDAGFLGPYVGADVPRPKIGGHQDAGLLLAISLRDQEVELVPTSTELTCVHLPSRAI